MTTRRSEAWGLAEIVAAGLEDFMVARVREPAWRRDALCQQAEVDEFFPNGRPPQRLKAMCAQCPVRQECLESALDSPWQPYGIWGGLSSSELMPQWAARHKEPA